MTHERQILQPASEAEACEIVAQARAHGRTLSIEGGGTRAGLGRPIACDSVLSTRKLTGITLYEPAELVLSARAGTPLSVIEDTLAEKGQMLAFEPVDYRAIYGTQGEPTIGAVAACNISGPRRLQTGAARDALIDALALFGIGYSWGGFESLATPVDPAPIRSASAWPPAGWDGEDRFGVRLAVGLEDPGDLIADLDGALATWRRQAGRNG